MSTPGRTKPCSPNVSKSRTAEQIPDITIAPDSPIEPRRTPSRTNDSRSNSCYGPPAAAKGSVPPELPPGAAPPPPARPLLAPERTLSRSASLSVRPSPAGPSSRSRRRPATIFDSLSEAPSIPELVDPRRTSNPPRYSQVVSPSSSRRPREKSSWRPSDSRASDSLYDSSEADARVPKNDVPERWERPFEVNTDHDILDPVLETAAEPEASGDTSLSGSALASFLASERRRDLSLADPFSEFAGRAASPRSPRLGSPNSPRIRTPRLTSPTHLEEPQVVRTRSISSPHITFRSPEPERRPETEQRRRPKYARHGWRPSQAAAGDHLYEPPTLDDDMPAQWERPFDLHDEYEIDVHKHKAQPEPEPETPIDTSAINSFLATERRRDMGTTQWANQLQSMGDSIRADPQTAAVLTRVATRNRDHSEIGRRHRRGHSRNESWDGSAILGNVDRRGNSEISRPSRQATIRAVLDPIPGAVPDCTADGREARRHARRIRQGREDHEDAPPAYMPDRPPMYVEGGTRA